MRHRIALGALVALAAVTSTGGAWAHAHVSPPVALANEGQVFTLAVPTEKEGATTTKIALTLPKGFGVDSYADAPGWTRSVDGDTVTWSGGSVPTDEISSFSFLGSADASGDYTFVVKQTYSDGSVVDWSGPESSDTPSPVVKAVSSFGGGGTSTVTWIALVLGAIGTLLGAVALLTRSGRSLA